MGAAVDYHEFIVYSKKMILVNPALLIMNLQVDFCSSSGFAAKLGRDISPMQQMLPLLKHFYKELKNAKIPVFFTQYIARKDLSPPNVKINKDREEKARFCLFNSRGSHLYYLKPSGSDSIVKIRYYDAFAHTELRQRLLQKKIRTLIITGVRTELSIDASAKRAVSEGLEVVVAKDMVNTYRENQVYQNAFLKLFGRYWGEILNSNQIIEALE